MKLPRGPGWPDFRGWAAAGLFGLTFYMLYMVGQNPRLLGVVSFMQYMSGVTAGGVLLVAMNLFGGNKASIDANARITDAVAQNVTPSQGPTPNPVQGPVPPNPQS